eukprot:m.203259 g.203259  ORF g.203259 m.203259 type:complete len:96 (+) comp15370_c0_seq2:244-531(+)
MSMPLLTSSLPPSRRGSETSTANAAMSGRNHHVHLSAQEATRHSGEDHLFHVDTLKFAPRKWNGRRESEKVTVGCVFGNGGGGGCGGCLGADGAA